MYDSLTSIQNASKSAKVLLALCVSAVLFLSIYAFSTYASIDEIFYIEPGVNWAAGRGFVSAVARWNANFSDTWGSSTPGMPMIYGAWFNLVGFGLLQSKALSLGLHLTGAFLVARWYARRFRPSLEVSFCVFLSLLITPTIIKCTVSCARLEVFALSLVAWFLHITLPTDRIDAPRISSAVLFGLCTVLMGLHFAGYFALACVAIFLLRPS